MKKNKILLSTLVAVTLLSVTANALSIDKAVELALINNNVLKEQVFKIKEYDENIKGAKTAYNPTFDVDYSYDAKNNERSSQTKHDSAFNATLSYNLFNGYSDKYSILSAQKSFSSTQYSYEATKQDIILKTKENFINFLKNRRNTIVQQNAVKLFQKQYDDSKNFYEQGVRVALNNLLEVEIELLQAKQRLLTSKSAQKIAKEELFNTMGLRSSESIDEVQIEKNENVLGAFDKKDLLNRNEVKALFMHKESLENSQRSLKGNYYPKVDANIKHKRYGDSFALNEKDGSYDPQNIATITLSWNLYNGGKDESDMVVYRHQMSQVNSQISDLKLKIDLQYSNAKEQYILTSENLKISNKALDQSRVNYEIVDNRFKEGVSTSKDLIDANYLLTQAQENYFRAYYDKLLAKATIERIFEK
ncbi:MAG: TolC family protein [Campylobacteraceae bacterium]|nr:TolC family protein [Campylobacteraceae bacterium]